MVYSFKIPSVGIGVENYEGFVNRIGLIKRLRTFMRGGAPFGKAGSGIKFLTTATEPPVNDQKLAGLTFCQSYQSLSTI